MKDNKISYHKKNLNYNIKLNRFIEQYEVKNDQKNINCE